MLDYKIIEIWRHECYAMCKNAVFLKDLICVVIGDFAINLLDAILGGHILACVLYHKCINEDKLIILIIRVYINPFKYTENTRKVISR